MWTMTIEKSRLDTATDVGAGFSVSLFVCCMRLSDTTNVVIRGASLYRSRQGLQL